MDNSQSLTKNMINEITRKRFKSYLVGFTRDLGKSMTQVFHPKLILLQIFAIMITIPLVSLDIDWKYFTFFRGVSYLQPLLFPAVIIGTFVPIIFPAMVYLYGVIEELNHLKYFGYTLTHTAVVGLFWSALYKSFTGRRGPEFEEYSADIANYSADFYFGFLLGGVFDGWPSGHTTIAVAFGLVFYQYQLIDEEKLQTQNDYMSKILRNRWLGLIYAIYIAFGISTNIHWLSDAIAGLFFGYCVAQASLRTTQNIFDPNSKEFDQISKTIEDGDFDNQVKYTFYTLLIIIIFSIIIPREIFGW